MITNLILSVMIAASPNLLVNPSFEKGLDGWLKSTNAIHMEPVREDGRTAARITVGPTDEIGFPLIYQEVPAQEGDILSAKVNAKGKGTREGVGAYMSIEFHNQAGERLTFSQTGRIMEDNTWALIDQQAAAPPDSVKGRLTLILNGRGEAFFDEAALERIPLGPVRPIEGPVTLTVMSQSPCESINGFGAEDDGWFYNPENASRGVNEEDYKIREGRIEWMDPDWVRMFIWHPDWCPSGDWETFTFDSPNMQSHYRSLDLYQRIGARVNLAGAEWGMKDPYGQPEKYAHAIGELYEYLIRKKGYTCLGDWTLSNEPNGAYANFGYSFEDFVKIHQLVKQEFERRGLKIRIIGSDDAQDIRWYRKCVENEAYFKTADLFSSHRYFPFADRVLAGYFLRGRLDPLTAKTPAKPFIVGEFGFHDGRSGTLENPLMETYPYAVWTTEFVIDGLNLGAAGFSVWCLHEMYYPGGGFMNYGLWNYKEDQWKVRPVYHAWANFSRETEAGEKVMKVESSHPRQVKATQVGDTLFWVNTTDQPASVKIIGAAGKEVRIQTEGTLQGDRETGVLEPVKEGGFTAPPQSFGYLNTSN